MEEIYIKVIQNGIRAIKLGSKTPQEANLSKSFTGLKPLNVGMYDELMNNYKAVVEAYNKKNPK